MKLQKIDEINKDEMLTIATRGSTYHLITFIYLLLKIFVM